MVFASLVLSELGRIFKSVRKKSWPGREKPIDAEVTTLAFRSSKKSGLVGTLAAGQHAKKTYINGFRRMVVVLLVVGWWVQNSGRVFCEYTLRLFGDRLKVWREGRGVYRSALPPQSCASRSVACVPRFKAWSRTACLQMINKRQPWS